MARGISAMDDSPPSEIPYCVWQERDIEKLRAENAELKLRIDRLEAALQRALEVNAVEYEAWLREMNELHEYGLRQRPVHVGSEM